jgi:dCTP deaminase
MKDDSAFDLLLFELIDLISRFYRHVQDLKYENTGNYIKIIDDVEECLQLILEKTVRVVREYNEGDVIESIKSLQGFVCSVKELHERTGCLPIIGRQVELLRFSRMLKAGLPEKIQREYNFSIVPVECVDQVIYLETPLSKFKNKLKEDDTEKTKNGGGTIAGNPRSHIAIPRIEIKNPLVWPTVAHEISHRLIDYCFPKNRFFAGFTMFLKREGVTSPKAFTRKDIKSRVLEYWCDFLGLLIMGPAFWFSQRDAMFLAGINDFDSLGHPPNQLRLWITHEILKHRFSDQNGKDKFSKPISKAYYSVFKVFKIIDDKTTDAYDAERVLAMQFFRYITHEFIFRKNNTGQKLAPDLESLLEKFLTYNKRDNSSAIISKLMKSLKHDFPIPSVRIQKNQLKEIPTDIRDILFAGALYKDSVLKNKIVASFKDIARCSGDIKEITRRFHLEISVNLGGLDSCLLRSIQVSEYVNLLVKTDEESEHDNSLRNQSPSTFTVVNTKQILNDAEIKSKMLKNKIRVIPLIDEVQIGSTSLDIRLGTSFQIYQSNHSGILDIISRESLEEAERNSSMIDLDYLNGIVLAPGQFALGHTLEYLVLSDNIAAELEGRSSYARLGLEIHMTAGFIDPGFNGVLTLELFNAGPNPIKMYPGLRIGQLRFFMCNKSSKPYNRNIDAKYKGLLSHQQSLFEKDYEIKYYAKAIKENASLVNKDVENAKL